MKQGLLRWHPCRYSPVPPPSIFSFPCPTPLRKFSHTVTAISATLDSVNAEQLTARERRQMRNERRESRAYNWREEVEERLIKKPKKRYASWTEELNLDNLALLGPQWWVIRVSRVSGQDTAQRLARSLVLNFPNMEFKVFKSHLVFCAYCSGF